MEVSFNNSKLSFGGFPAVDYFGDGSLYLLDSPGVSFPPLLILEIN